MNNDSGSRHRIKTTGTVFGILEAIQRLNGAGVAELADELDLAKSTVHKHLNSLVEKEYIVKSNGIYDLSLKFLDLGAYAREKQELYHISESELKQLAEETTESVWLMQEEYGWGIFLDKKEGPRAARTNFRVGERTYLHTTSSGKAILAHLPKESVEEIIARHGLPKIARKTITNPSTLFDELEQIRETGVAFGESSRAIKVRAVSSPIITNEEIRGAIGVAGPKERLTGTFYREKIPSLLRGSANAIELSLTYQS